MRRSTQTESINIILHTLRIDSSFLHSLFKVLGVVNTLSSGKNLLTSHEEVVRVRVALRERESGERSVWNEEIECFQCLPLVTSLNTHLISRIWHGVERSDLQWEFVEHEEVGLILLTN